MSFPTPFTRRSFLNSSLVMASAAATLPSFLNSTAVAMAEALGGLSSIPGVPEDHVLVVLQFSGGNDGLNTVVPFGMSEYYKRRPGIGIPEKDALKLSKIDGVGLHPQLAPLKDLYDDGMLSMAALSALSHGYGNGESLLAVLAFAQRWTAAIDWSDYDISLRTLEACNAFVDPGVAETTGRRLRMPGTASAGGWSIRPAR